MLDILGENGTIKIQKQDGTDFAVIDNTTQEDENGDIIINYEEKQNNIKIITSKPQKEGTITFYNNKAVLLDTEYDKELLKQINILETQTTIQTNRSSETIKNQIKMLDTSTKAELEINKENLSTLEKNKDVKIITTLKTNGMQYDLYQNPTISLELPEEIEEIKVISIDKLYDDELNIKSARLIEENGKKYINIEFEGNQTKFGNGIQDGMQIVITCDITLKKESPTKQSELILRYTNQNREEGNIQEERLKLNIVSKYGVLLYNKIEENNQRLVETIDDKQKEQEIKVNKETKRIKGQISVINNYSQNVENIIIEGNVDENKSATINEITTNIENAKIEYSKNQKAYKITIDQNSIEPAQSVLVGYNLSIPGQISEDIMSNVNVSYNYLGKEEEQSSNILLKASPDESLKDVTTNPIEGLETKVKAVVGDKQINSEDTVKTGEMISYEITITNNTGVDIQNLKVKANQTNALLYDLQEISLSNPELGETDVKEHIYQEQQTDEKIFDVIDNLPNGASITLNYKEIIQDTEEEKTEAKLTFELNNTQEEVVFMENDIEKAKLQLLMEYINTEETPIYSSTIFETKLKIKNMSDETVNNTIVEVTLSDLLDVEKISTLSFDESKIEILEQEKNKLKLKINWLNAEEATEIKIVPFTDSLSFEQEKDEISIIAKATTEDAKVYTSNLLKKELLQGQTHMEISQTSNIENGSYIKTGDNIKFEITVTNHDEEARNVKIEDVLSNAFIIQSVKLQTKNKEEDITEEVVQNRFVHTGQIEGNSQIIVKIDSIVDTAQITSDTVKNIASIEYNSIHKDTEEIIFKVKENEEPVDPENPEKPTDPENPSNPEDPDNPGGDNNDEESTKYKLSGAVWLDENKNGTKDPQENLMSDVKVRLVDLEGNFVKDENNNVIEKTTSADGKYEFEVKNGQYSVIFMYDSQTYDITQYQKTNVDESNNSDANEKTITIDNKEQKVALTDKITILNNDKENIDLGLIEKQKFDLSLEKYVSKIIVQNKKETKSEEYKHGDLPKIEIHSKQFDGSTVLIEYKIVVKNEGELEGYVNDIIDYIPTGYKFNSELNKDWYMGTDGNVHTNSLSKEKIEVGQTKEITLILTKTLNSEDTVMVVNTAEVGESISTTGVTDYDSVAGNRKEGEDDISTANAIISVSTGIEETVGIVAIIITIIALSIYVYIIKRRR